MTDADSVAAALARLVNGRADSHGRDTKSAPTAGATEEPPEQVVAEAETAFERLSTAGAFVADGGEQRLQGAIDRAAGADGALAERGRAVRATLTAFRATARAPTQNGGGQE